MELISTLLRLAAFVRHEIMMMMTTTMTMMIVTSNMVLHKYTTICIRHRSSCCCYCYRINGPHNKRARTCSSSSGGGCGGDTYRFVVYIFFILILLVRTAQVANATSNSQSHSNSNSHSHSQNEGSIIKGGGAIGIAIAIAGEENQEDDRFDERIINKNNDNNKSTTSSNSLRIQSITTALGVDLISNNNDTMMSATAAAAAVAVAAEAEATAAEIVVKTTNTVQEQKKILIHDATAVAAVAAAAGDGVGDGADDDDADADADAEENVATLTKLNSHSEINSAGSSSSSATFASSTRNIINLINRDNVLLRQLREKAKHDSLESIKMHILMRLKLTKLPNITSPIAVPQNILENFYKNYNATLSWRQVANQKMHNHHHRRQMDRIKSSDFHVSQTFADTSDDDDHVDDGGHLTSSSHGKTEFNMQNDGYEAHTGSESVIPEETAEKTRMNFSNLREYEDYVDLYDDNENESVLSHINSIYLFPEMSRIRHNRKSDVLLFKLGDSHSGITQATMHLYIRGWDWIHKNDPDLLVDIKAKQQNDVVIAIHRAIRRSNATTYTHKLKVLESRHKIPTGLGQWVKIDVIPLFSNWIESRNESSQEILIKGVQSWMKPLIVTTDNSLKNPLTVHIEIGTKIKHRHKRSSSLDCQESDHEMRCCRYPLKVNFTNFGWHFVVAPTSFDAYFCNGECKVGYLEQYTHTHLASLTTSATPCCSPTKMSSLSLLYFDDNHKLVLSVIPNMSVEKCSCS